MRRNQDISKLADILKLFLYISLRFEKNETDLELML